jgi:digeranylgeranylglycerophospholipid reductase
MPVGIPFLLSLSHGGGRPRKMPVLRRELCTHCGGCVSLCPSEAITLAETRLLIDEGVCTECGLCIGGCPSGALTSEPEISSRSVLPRRDYDVAVVGAGPAGSTAAWSAAERGLSVMLLEKRQEIGSPVRCAEGINSEMLSQFLEPEERWISARVSRSQITTVDTGETLSLAGEEVGYVLERRVFDRALSQKAIDAGAHVLVKTTVEELIEELGAVRGVRIADGRTVVDVAAKVIVGADGVESRVGQWAGLDCLLRPSDCLVCAQYMLSGIDVDPQCCYYYLGESLAPGGYAWVFPKGDRSANVGVGVQADVADSSALEYLLRFIEEQPWLAQGSPVTLITGNVPVGVAAGPIVCDGLMLVGDAARQADPLTGGGIAGAMLAGRLAAEVAAEAVKKGDTSASTLRAYERRWRESRGRKMERNHRLKTRFTPADRTSKAFVRAFAVATVGK